MSGPAAWCEECKLVNISLRCYFLLQRRKLDVCIFTILDSLQQDQTQGVLAKGHQSMDGQIDRPLNLLWSCCSCCGLWCHDAWVCKYVFVFLLLFLPIMLLRGTWIRCLDSAILLTVCLKLQPLSPLLSQARSREEKLKLRCADSTCAVVHPSPAKADHCHTVLEAGL